MIIDQMIGDDEEMRQMIAEERFNADIAQMIYSARTAAGLTQAELARRIGTKQPVIARLEDADYEGHSLTMLNRIARALDQRLLVQLVGAGGKKRPKRGARGRTVVLPKSNRSRVTA